MVISESMLNCINDTKHKDDETPRREKEAMKDARWLQKQKDEEEEKKKIQ